MIHVAVWLYLLEDGNSKALRNAGNTANTTRWYSAGTGPILSYSLYTLYRCTASLKVYGEGEGNVVPGLN